MNNKKCKSFWNNIKMEGHLVRVITFILCLVLFTTLADVTVLASSQIPANELTSKTEDCAFYTVEFTYGELQYVLPGDSRVELTTILDTIGIDVNGDISEVTGSNDSLFKPVNEDGTWYIEAVTAFTSTEWLKVKIGEAEYEIVVTDATVSGDGTIKSPYSVSGKTSEDFGVDTYLYKIFNQIELVYFSPKSGYIYIDDESTSKSKTTSNFNTATFPSTGYYYLYNATKSTTSSKLYFHEVTTRNFNFLPNNGTSGTSLVKYTYGVFKDGSTTYLIKDDNNTKQTAGNLKYQYGSTTSPTRTGYTFVGWNAEADGSGTRYAVNAGIPASATGDTNIYAEWYADYTINYNANTSDTVTGMPSSTTIKYDTATNLSSETPTRNGYTFLGWSAATDATEATWTAGASAHTANSLKVLDVDIAISKTAGGSKTLYAVWKRNAFTVTFDSKGGSDVDTQSVTPGETATEPTAPTKADYKFLGWTTDSEPTTSSTKFNFSTEITEDLTLYAIWESHDHVWAYAADGNKLCAYCTVDGYNCSYYGTESELSKAITVEVNAPEERSGSLTYDGNAYVATITDTDGKWNLTFAGLPSIEYGYKEFGMEAASYSSVTDTKDAGYYKASITAGDKTAYVEYQIAKKAVTLSVTMDNYQVNSQASAPSASGGPDGAAYDYKFKKKGADDSTYSDDVPTTPWGDYAVKATYAGDKNHESATATCDFQIKPKERDTIKVVMSDYVYGQATAPVPSMDPAEIDENPSITFKYHVIDPSAEWLVWTGDTSALDVLSDTDKYEMKAVIGATASYAEKDTPAKGFVVKKGEWKVTAPTAKTGLTYNCADQDLVNAGSVEDGGVMLYSLNGADYNASISKVTDAGTYDVHYKIGADTNHNEFVCDSPVSVTIAKADWNVTAPTAINPSVTGEALELVNEGEVKDADGSTVTGKLLYSLNGTDYSTTIPTATTVGSYTVYYKVTGDDNHNEYAAKTMTATIEKISRPELDIPSVSMEDYTYGQTETLPSPKLSASPLEGPTVTYYYNTSDSFEGSTKWDNITSETLDVGTYYMFAELGETDTYRKCHTEGDEFVIFTGTCVVTAPTGKALKYNGRAQELINKGSAVGGLMQYSTDDVDYSTMVPTGVQRGDYDVYYKVVGDANHEDVAAQMITVTIGMGEHEVTAPKALNPVYNGEEQILIEEGSCESGTILYSLDGETYTPSVSEIKRKDIDSYTVYYMVEGDDNYNVYGPEKITAKIVAKEEPTPTPKPLPFKDVKEGKWYYKAVDFVYQNGIMVGKGDDRFDPTADITRQEFVTILYNYMGKPEVSGEFNKFKDVPAGKWFSKPVQWGYENQVLSGKSDDEFGLGDVTRQEAAKFMYNFAVSQKITLDKKADLGIFSDADMIGSWAEDAVSYMAGYEVMKGKGNGIFDPTAKLTRGEAAQLIKNFIETFGADS